MHASSVGHDAAAGATAGGARTVMRRALLFCLALSASGQALAALPDRVAAIAAALDVPENEISVYVAPVDGGPPVLEHLPDVARTPASTLKLLTTFAALDGLTPAYRWHTEAWALGELRDGTLDGDLLLRGGGDPWLVAQRYWSFVGGIRRAGVERVTGDLVIDDSAFELPAEDPGAFDGQRDRVYNVLPHALLVNFTAARFDVEARGSQVDVDVFPALPNLDLVNRLRTRGGGCGGFQRGVAVHVRDAEPAPSRGRVILEGRFPESCHRYGLTRSVLTPQAYAWGLFDTYFRQFGGEPPRAWRTGTLPAPPDEDARADLEAGYPPAHRLLHRFESRPLGELVQLVNKHSNNVMTRHLQLTLGIERFGTPATPEKGERALHEQLERHGIDLQGLVIDNPSGLTREARITARQMGAVLSAAWRSPVMPEFVASLGIVGLDGTVRRRLAGRPAAGRMHLKTGTIDEVSAIAGYALSASGTRHVVAVFVNGPLADRGPGREIQDALLEWVHGL